MAKGTCLKNTKKVFATIPNTMVRLSTTKRPINVFLMTGHMLFVMIEGNVPSNPKVKKNKWRITKTDAYVPMKPHNCGISECNKANITQRRDQGNPDHLTLI